jgi:ABC-type nitrate/sulfonate/bicarbonate transport system permease component
MASLQLARSEGHAQRWKWALRAISLLVVAVVWETLGRSLDSLLMPTFTSTVTALVTLLLRAETWNAMWVSNQALILGYALAAFVGVPLGLLLGRSARLGRVADPYLNVLLVTPMSAMIPLIIVAAGLGLSARVLVVFVFAFVIIAVTTQAGYHHVNPGLIEMARSFGATEAQLWRTVILPGAMPALMAGLRLGLGRAVTGMVNVELLLVAVGFGRLLLLFQADFESSYVYAVVLIVLAEAVLLMQGIKHVEQRLTPWEGERRVDD